MTAAAGSGANGAAPERSYSQREVLTWLSESEVLHSLSDADLLPFLRAVRILNFKPMDEVIGEGKYSAALYIVIAGRFKVLRSAALANHLVSGTELEELDTFQAGACFGEYSLIDRQPASASVVAVEASQAIQIPRREFESILMSDYRVAKTVYHNLALLLTGRLRRSLKV